MENYEKTEENLQKAQEELQQAKLRYASQTFVLNYIISFKQRYTKTE